MATNPFQPGFGTPPRVLVGRGETLAAIRPVFTGFDPGHAYRAVHFEAHRGAGKTVLLDAVQDLAAEEGWWVVQDDAGSTATSLVPRLIDRVLERRDELEPSPRRRISSAGVLGASIEVDELTPRSPLITLRSALESLVELEPNGILLSIDEIHDASDADLAEVGNAIQHLHRQGKPVVVVLAGLPSARERRREPTFLARCRKPPVGAITDAEIERGFVETAAISGGSFTDRALVHAVVAAAGYPYMMQLVGYHAWEAADEPSSIDHEAVARALPIASQELVRSVTTFVDERLSDVERRFLIAMSLDDGPSHVADIRERMGKSAQYVNVYRTRLLETGVIRQAARGQVAFAVPGLRALLADRP